MMLIQVFRSTVWLVLLLAIFVPMERLFGLHPVKIFRKQVWVDVGWYFINSIVPTALMAFPLILLSRALQGADPGGFYSLMKTVPLGWKLFLVLLVSDLGSYWGHRASHSWKFLWRFHAVHHSAEEMDWLVNTRAHPFDLVFTRMSGIIPVYLLGLAQPRSGGLDPLVAWMTIIGTLWTFFIHANVRWRFGPLEWVFSTPAFHHWHHTNDEHRDRNFAALFPLWDRLFGTAWLPAHWPPVYGIDARLSESLGGQLMDPFFQHPTRPVETALADCAVENSGLPTSVLAEEKQSRAALSGVDIR